jgi:hypothetical protein
MSATTIQRRARPLRRGNVTPSMCRCADLPLALWPCAQRSAQCQRRGRFVPESNRHPAKMLPELARRAISAYSDPGDVVLDPMCGIGTTVVEASHLDRCGIGVELEGRWAELAAQNVEHARGQGATGPALVTQGDARQLGAGLLDEYAGTAALVLTSPPYADACLGDSRAGDGMARCRASEGRRVTAADLAMAAQLKRIRRYGDSAGSVARLRYGTTEEALSPPPPPPGGGAAPGAGALAPPTTQTPPPPPPRGELPVGDGVDLRRLRTDAQARRPPRARHEEHALARDAAEHRWRHDRRLPRARPRVSAARHCAARDPPR